MPVHGISTQNNGISKPKDGVLRGTEISLELIRCVLNVCGHDVAIHQPFRVR